MVRALECSDGDDDESRMSAAAFRGGRLAAGGFLDRPHDGPLTRARFVALIDRCVRHLAAECFGDPAERDAGDIHAAEAARVQLWRWLHEDATTLDDGTPVGFALFDAALQRCSERLPRRGARAQERVTRAAWLLAELTHAPTLTRTGDAAAPDSPVLAAGFPRYPADAATD